jgi:hypothetical protein
LHLSFTSSKRPMRIFGAIVGAQSLLMQSRETNFAERRAVGSQLVGGDSPVTSGLSFRYTQDRTLPHRELSPRGPARRGRVAGLFFDQKKLAGFDVVKITKDIHVPWRPARSSHASYVAM